VPIYYGAIPFSWSHIIGAVLFFPLFYFVIEVFDRYTPNPKAIMMDLGQGEKKEAPMRPQGPIASMPGREYPRQNYGPTPQNQYSPPRNQYDQARR
jgi:hypothetical protein